MPEGLAQMIVWVLFCAVVIPVILMIARRRWIARMGGVFECSVRLREKSPGSGWTLGVARYHGEQLEWFRTFSLVMRPQLVFLRADTAALEQREPSQSESERLYGGERIVKLLVGSTATWELSMSPDSLTGLLSWLEAAPPGLQYRVAEPNL